MPPARPDQSISTVRLDVENFLSGCHYPGWNLASSALTWLNMGDVDPCQIAEGNWRGYAG